MQTDLVIVIAVLIGVFALGMYMDWFGLWMSKADLQKQIDASSRLRQELPKPGDQADRC